MNVNAISYEIVISSSIFKKDRRISIVCTTSTDYTGWGFEFNELSVLISIAVRVFASHKTQPYLFHMYPLEVIMLQNFTEQSHYLP
jgi:hypothetical protein